MVTEKWGNLFSLGQSPDYTQRRAMQPALPWARQEGTTCFFSSWARFPVISIWVVSSFAAHLALGADNQPLLNLLIDGRRKRGRGERGSERASERERENQNLSPHRTAIKEHMYQLKKFLGDKSFLIEHSLFSQLM